MPLIDSDRPRAIERIRGKLREMQYLRGTGPVSQEFFQWVDEAFLVVEQAFGAGSAEVEALRRAVGDRSPIYSQGIPPHGEWGLRARLDRAEIVLNDGIARLERPPEPPVSAAAAEDEGPAMRPREIIHGRDLPCEAQQAA